LTLCSAPAALATEEPADAPDESAVEAIDNDYVESSTIYDESNVVETEPTPDEEESPADEESVVEDDDLFGTKSFDAENAAQLAGDKYVRDEIIVKFKDPAQVPGKEKQLQHEIEKVEKVGFVESLGMYVVKVDELGKNPNAVLNRFKNNKYIEFVEPNYILKSGAETPNDPNYRLQSATLGLLNAPAGWEIIKGSSSPVVAVVDSGVASHADLSPLLGGYSAVSNLSPGNDKLGHGTNVAGVIGMIGNNGIGGVGMNWNASIMPVKVDDANGTMSTANVAKGIIWAADNGARIINLSLGTTADAVTLRNAVDYAYSKGCAIFAATGNESSSSVCYPARYANVMAVGATANGKVRVSWSNYGDGINVVANASYNTTTPTGDYKAVSGTSFSSPQVAGLASLVWALNPGLTNDQVYRLIEQGAKPLDAPKNEVGFGLIDCAKTLQLAQATAGGAPTKPAEPEPQKPAEPEPQQPPQAAKSPVPSDAKSIMTTVQAGTRNNYNGSVGYEFEALSEMKVSCVGRPENGTMSNPHTIYIWNVETKALMASAQVMPSSALDNGFKVAELDKAITLTAGKKYRIASSETSGGDKWFDIGNLKNTGDCRITTAVYSNEGAATSYPANEYGSAGQGYVGVTLFYTTVPVQPETPQEVRTPPVITLTGFTEMILENGQAFVEPGYTAKDCKNVNLTSSVKVTNNIKTTIAGLYTVTYDVADSTGLTARATRSVTVKEKPVVVPPLTAPKITIIGSNPIILHSTSNTVYKEQMAKAVDHNGKDISSLVKVSGTVNRTTPGTYLLTYSITSPDTGLTATTTRNVRIVAPTEKKDPRTKYGLNAQGKQGAKISHTGIVAGAQGFMDLKITSIDKNMTIITQLVDTTTKKAIFTDTFTTAGTKQYKIDKSKYELVVNIDKANGNSKYDLELLMPETEAIFVFETAEVPLAGLPQIAPIGSNPIILHIGGTPYTEQGARATDYQGNDLSDQVVIEGTPNTSVAGTYTITYSVVGAMGKTAIATRDVKILDPNDKTIILEPEVPLAPGPGGSDNSNTGLIILVACIVAAGLAVFFIRRHALQKN